MTGFIYNGQSTDTILDSSPLMLVSFDSIDDATGVDREDVIGERTITKPIANEYGVKNTPLSFEYALMKTNLDPFTDEEQIAVERWLTSPKFSQDLIITFCKQVEKPNIISDSGHYIVDNNNTKISAFYEYSHDEEIRYCGKFLSTKWTQGNGGWIGVKFTFQNNTAYPVQFHKEEFNVRAKEKITINCKSDELEEYIYPIITITNPLDSGYVSIKNITDNGNVMKIRVYQDLTLKFDCRHCIPSDSTKNGIVSYKDLGWNDVGNIYWLRLLPGENELEITGSANIVLSYNSIYKRVGGWL